MYSITHNNENLFMGSLSNCLSYLIDKLGAVSVTEAVEEGYSIAGATLAGKVERQGLKLRLWPVELTGRKAAGRERWRNDL